MGADAPAPTDVDDVRAYFKRVGKDGALRDAYRLPGEVTHGLHKPEPALPEAPLIVLINSKSGGRTGPQTAAALRHALGYSQVFDMGEHRPDQVLETVYKNFDALEKREPERARALRSRLRVIVAGGDGTVGWTLQAIKRCGIEPHPPVAIIPLGTGNDMSRTFGWGAAFDPAWVSDHDSLYKTLRNVADAAPTQLDRWQLRMRAPGPQYFQKEMPPTIMASNDAPKESAKEYQGLSWNYLSIGMDARTVYGFDRLRAKKPQLAPGGNINKFWYVFFCCFSGWFVGGGSTLPDKLHMEIQDAKGNWSHLHVPDNLSSVVFLNNQSYAGGQDLWQHDKGGDKDGWARPTYNDGLIDIVGFQSGYHAGAVLAKATPCTRLAQAAGVRVRVKGLLDSAAQEKGETDHVYVQLDGEPWQQDVPSGEGEFVEMEFTRVGQSTMLKAPPSSTR